MAYLGLAPTAIGQSDLVELGLEDLGLEKALSGGLDDDLTGDFDASSGEDENVLDASYDVVQPSIPPAKHPTPGMLTATPLA